MDDVLHTIINGLNSVINNLYPVIDALHSDDKVKGVDDRYAIVDVGNSIVNAKHGYQHFPHSVIRTCAAAIRASSCASLSGLISASSISVLPINFLESFLKTVLSMATHLYSSDLLCSALPPD